MCALFEGVAGMTGTKKAQADEANQTVPLESADHRQAPKFDALDQNQVRCLLIEDCSRFPGGGV